VTPGTTDTPQAPVEINLTSKKYSVSGKMISGIAEHTTVATFRKNVTISAGEMKVYDTSNKEIKDGEVTTGSVVKLIRDDGTVDKSFTLVVLGDINSDGKISILDLVMIRKHLLGIISVKNEFFEASDINGDGKISIMDLVAIRKHLLGFTSIS
ncbi:MAG: dockerin type I repeat-containing protein, partial [Clostridia bacterium]|nr:dockerin type I repeat-containing protein [Clostridia bacterium]